MFEKTDRILVKASPLLDLHQGLIELKTANKIFVVAVDHECREVLLLWSRAGVAEPTVVGVNLSSRFLENNAGPEEFSFTFTEEKNTKSVFSDPLSYLYEPHSWILKAGAFKLVGHRYGLSKLQINTHLYASDQLVERFPGRIFRIETLKPDTTKLKEYFPEGKANVFVRNYPLLPEQLKKKLKLRDGGEKYLIGFSGAKEKFLVAATRVK
jgi:PG_1098 ferredoxin-like domain/THUMP domain-like